MRVFDVPAGNGPNDRPMRIAVHGTCRVHDPFEALAAAGRAVKVWASNNAVSYTFGEARQMLAHCLGASPIPAPLQPFVFQDPEGALPPAPARRRIIESVEAYLFEVCEWRQIRYRDAYFQIQSFTKNFISRHGSAVLPWYRVFSLGQAVSDELVADVMAKLSHLSDEERELTESILRETRIEPTDVTSGVRIISEMAGEKPWQWTLVPHFMVPGLSGTMMNDRQKVRQIVSEVASSCGVGYFDPSALIALHGREKALDNGGKDPYHYSGLFQTTIGRALLQEPFARLANHDTSSLPNGTVAPAVTNVGLVGAALNSVLIALHRDRVSKLGVDGSGLHDHYAFLLEQRTVLRQSELTVAEIIVNFLPRFERYDVLRSGLGELAFLLSAMGCRTMAFDPFASRVGAIKAGIEHLRDCRFPNSEQLDISHVVVPELTGSENALAVACLLMMTLSPEDEQAMLTRLEKYRAVLFYPAALIRARPQAADQEALVERFRRAGFTHVKEYPAPGLVYCAKDNTHA